MALTNNIKKQVDLPVWEWLRFCPSPTSTTTNLGISTCTENGRDRYIYFAASVLTTQLFYRYDTITDSWQQLASLSSTLANYAAMKYVSYCGIRTRVLDSGASSVTIGACGQILKGCKITVVSGTGAGQVRTISSVAEPVKVANGIVSTGSSNQVTDNTKKWRFNQWSGYQVRTTFGTGPSQVRNILYNDQTNLYVYDSTYYSVDPQNNFAFSSSLGTTSTNYVIESSVVTVDSPWTVQPDVTSKVAIESGGIWAFNTTNSLAFVAAQYYDVVRDSWMTRTRVETIIPTSNSQDQVLESFSDSAGAFDSGTATSGAAYTLTDSGKTWDVDRWAGYQLRITGGTGAGQKRRIVGVTTSTLHVSRPWVTNPDSTSTYGIYGESDKLLYHHLNSASIMQIDIENDLWSDSDIVYSGTARHISVQLGSFEPLSISGVVRNTGGLTSVAVNAAGSGYVIGDILTLAGGTNGKVRVNTITSSGGVASVEICRCGSGYSTTAGAAVTGGTGTSCTIQIVSVGATGYVTTQNNHFFKNGDTVTIAGCATDTSWNGSFTVIGSDASNTFDVSNSGSSSSPTAATSQSATVLVDASQNWGTNELVGRLLRKVLGGSPGGTTSEVRKITANTATTITVTPAFSLAAVNGGGRYHVVEPYILGRDEQYKQITANGRGWATSGSATTLVDSSKNWAPGQWAGYKFRIVCGTGINNEITITSNTETTLTFGSQSFSPDTTSKYLIMDTFGQATGGSNSTIVDTAKNWGVNQFAGKRVKIISGAGYGYESTISSNTATTLTYSSVLVAADSTSNYCIAGGLSGSGGYLAWAWGSTNDKGRYIWRASSGGTTPRFDRIDITSGVCELDVFTPPVTETLSTGSMWAYDGKDRIYYMSNSTGRFYYLDLLTYTIVPASTMPLAPTGAALGNKINIFQTEDGLKYLWIARPGGNEVFRTLIFW